MKTLFAATLCILMLASARAQKTAPPDAQWVKSFAAPCDAAVCAKSGINADNKIGKENALNTDPRWSALLHASLRQRQWFFNEHGFTPLADLAQTFMGVPGNALLDEDRYVTADGCYPHLCVLRGMVWVDTGANPAKVIFVATDLINDLDADPGQLHLWIFANGRLDFARLPPDFLLLKRWHDTNEAHGYKETIAFVTFVQPNGGQSDLAYSMLFHPWKQPGVKK